MANTFAKQHSLCKLAQSLKPYWSGSPASTPEAMVEWEECMSSLLEVASSVALMTDERNVLSVLDVDTYSSVTEVRTLALDFVGKSCWSRVSPPALSRVGFRGEVLLLFAQQCSCSEKHVHTAVDARLCLTSPAHNAPFGRQLARTLCAGQAFYNSTRTWEVPACANICSDR